MSSSCSKSRFMAQSEICYDPRVSGERRFQWNVALILFGVLFLGVSDTQLVAPLLPLIASDLGITPGHAGIIVTTYSLAAAAFALLVGPVSDRVGRKKVLVSGLAVFSLASFFTYHVSTFGALVILRALTGLAAGTLSTSALSFAGDYYPYEERGRAMGILSMGYFVAFVAGVPAGALAASPWDGIGYSLAYQPEQVQCLPLRSSSFLRGRSRPHRNGARPDCSIILESPTDLRG